MDLKFRIDKIRPYFISFNVVAEESAAYAVVRFPKGWKIPDVNALKANFKIELAPTSTGGYLFASEISNGTEGIFDAIDYVVDFNKKVEERSGLLEAKIKELAALFASETLEKLKTLKFTFEPPKKGGKKNVQKKNEAAQTETPTEPVETDKPEVVETPTEPVAEEAKPNEEPVVEDNSLLGLAKTLTEG